VRSLSVSTAIVAVGWTSTTVTATKFPTPVGRSPLAKSSISLSRKDLTMTNKPIEEMTDSEKLDELVQFTRTFASMLEMASQNPMLSMMLPKM
jgi:hypothetical protein